MKLSLPQPLYPSGKNPNMKVGLLREWLKAVEKRKSFTPVRNRTWFCGRPSSTDRADLGCTLYRMRAKQKSNMQHKCDRWN